MHHLGLIHAVGLKDRHEVGPERLWGTCQWAGGRGLPPMQKYRRVTVKSEGGDRSRRGRKWAATGRKRRAGLGGYGGFSPGDRGGGKRPSGKKQETKVTTVCN